MKCKMCVAEATRFARRHKKVPLCDMHYRFHMMRINAVSALKDVPSFKELETLFLGLVNMECKHCSRVMRMFQDYDGDPKVISLQHYRDGSFGLICLSCNVRQYTQHGDNEDPLPIGLKKCTKCGGVKEFPGEFYTSGVKVRADGSTRQSYSSWCRECMSMANKEYHLTRVWPRRGES